MSSNKFKKYVESIIPQNENLETFGIFEKEEVEETVPKGTSNFYGMSNKLTQLYNEVKNPAEFLKVLFAIGMLTIAKKSYGISPSKNQMIQLNKKARNIAKSIYSMELEGGNLQDPQWAATVAEAAFPQVTHKYGDKPETRGEKGARKDMTDAFKAEKKAVKSHRKHKKAMREEVNNDDIEKIFKYTESVLKDD